MTTLGELEENHKGERTEQNGGSNTVDYIRSLGGTCKDSKVILRGRRGTRERYD